MKERALLLIVVVLLSGAIARTHFFVSSASSSQSVSTVSDQSSVDELFESVRLQTPFSRSGENALAVQSAPTTGSDVPVSRIGGDVAASSSAAILGAVLERPAVSVDSEGGCADIGVSIFFVQPLDGDSAIIEHNSDNRWPIASITKLMSSLVASDGMDPATPVTITQWVRDQVGVYASFGVGSTLSVNDLVRSALVASSNDAAYALAESYGYDAFIAQMNDRANALGMSQTTFFEPSGLSYLNQSTARDLVALLRYLYHQRPSLLETTRKKSISVRDLTKGKYVTLFSTDSFAGQSTFYGGKTGYIDESGQNLVGIFKVDGTLFAAVVLGSNDRFGDMQTLLDCVASMESNN